MKLHRVSASVSVDLVIASDEPPDWDCIKDAAQSEFRENQHLCYLTAGAPVAVLATSDLPGGWAGAIPYGEGGVSGDDRTCAQILAANKEQADG